MGTSTAFAAGSVDTRFRIARAFTVSGTGGATATLTSSEGKLRTSMATTSLGEIRTATTAALTAGTKTFDVNNTFQWYGWVPATAGSAPICNVMVAGGTSPALVLWNQDPGEHPFVFAQDEGFAIVVTVPATGTWLFTVGLIWSEVTAF